MKDKAKKRFVYHKRTADEIRKHSNRSLGMYDSIVRPEFKMWAPREGENQVRYLPRTWEDVEAWGNHYGIDVWIHGNVGADNQRYLCRKKMLGEPCCLCDGMAELQREGENKAADELRPYATVLVWVIDRNDEDLGPQPWASPAKKIDNEVSARAVDKRTGAAIDLDDPEAGYDVEFSKKKGKEAKIVEYSGVDIARQSTPLSDDPDTAEKWLEFVTENPLPEILNFYDEEYVKGVFAGKQSKREAGEDESPRTRHAPKEGPEEDEEDAAPPARAGKKAPITDPDEDLDDDEDTAPIPPKRKPAPVVADDDDVVEEEEEAPTPPRRSVTASGSRLGRPTAKPANGDGDDDDEEDDAPVPQKRKPAAAAPPDDDDDGPEEEETPQKPVQRTRVR